MSAKKRDRQIRKRTIRNQSIRSRTRTFVKSARVAIDSGDKELAQQAVRRAVSELDRAASKGVIHSKNAARHKSRLMKRLEAAHSSG